MWPCHKLETCPGCHPALALRQLGEAAADPHDLESGQKQVQKWSKILRSTFLYFKSLPSGIKLLTRTAHNCGQRGPLSIVIFWLADPVNGDSGATGAGGQPAAAAVAATPVAPQGAAVRCPAQREMNAKGASCYFSTCWAHMHYFEMDKVLEKCDVH